MAANTVRDDGSAIYLEQNRNGSSDPNPGGTLVVVNSILADSTAGVDCRPDGTSARVISLGHNIVESPGNCTFAGPNDWLGSNGGPTQTMRLLGGSPAIDAGFAAECSYSLSVNGRDQRGEVRPRDGSGDGIAVCDIGALEETVPVPSPTPTATAGPTPSSVSSSSTVSSGALAGAQPPAALPPAAAAPAPPREPAPRAQTAPGTLPLGVVATQMSPDLGTVELLILPSGALGHAAGSFDFGSEGWWFMDDQGSWQPDQVANTVFGYNPSAWPVEPVG